MGDDSIVISASNHCDDYCTFDLTVSTSWVRQSISFLGYTDTFEDFGKSLMNFPNNTAHEVWFQEGKDEGYGPWYLSVKAYCYNDQGHTALHIIIDNQEPLPKKCRVEFSILAEAASINNLGCSLFNWEIKQQQTIEWKAQTS
ncbi:hypothetical protein GCM10011375_01990 [Hymenobacter qilianensis]|uniref:Uncharacterized protein n=2 Tax=Hymenobacter qilianensis TaxID=1385715 RepID=A0ACB5PLH5_9BACT|nr:hypothetical protein [Hymenobacter qilianensis]QNP50860.1 hypothetical protein H9L05_11790 [Hymenobacter qilianensis]GGF50071.1 hypothetical protein GCM10011375_01990 [Hymenobacter qilianensis]